MLISHVCRFIYLKTRKTAGTSVEIYFEPFCIDPKLYDGERHNRPLEVSEWGVVGSRGSAADTWYNHMPAVRILQLIGHETWNSYLKFCVIRNPFDKVVSWFWHTLDDRAREELVRADFSVVRNRFEEWTSRKDFPEDRFIYTIAGDPAMDEFIRYERLTSDLQRVCRRLDIPWQPERLGRYKGEYRRRPYAFEEYYTQQSARRVEQTFAWELEYFNYSCGPTALPEPQTS
jgi:hypothetical protein